MINVEIKRRIDLLQGYIEKVSVYTDLSEIAKNEEKQAAMERWFLLMVDEAIDINSALVYQLGGKIPESARESFLGLVDIKVIDSDFANKISESIRVRNELTHDYEKRQKSLVIGNMIKFIELYKKYAKILIDKYVNTL